MLSKVKNISEFYNRLIQLSRKKTFTDKQVVYAQYLYRVTPIFWYDGSMSWWLEKRNDPVEFSDFNELQQYPKMDNVTVVASIDSKPVRTGNTISVSLKTSDKITMLETHAKKNKDVYVKVLLSQIKTNADNSK